MEEVAEDNIEGLEMNKSQGERASEENQQELLEEAAVDNINVVENKTEKAFEQEVVVEMDRGQNERRPEKISIEGLTGKGKPFGEQKNIFDNIDDLSTLDELLEGNGVI